MQIGDKQSFSSSSPSVSSSQHQQHLKEDQKGCEFSEGRVEKSSSGDQAAVVGTIMNPKELLGYLFGRKEESYKYELRLVEPITVPFYRERNFS